MKHAKLLCAAAWALLPFSICAQRVSNATFLHADEKSDVVIPFDYLSEGKPTPIEWGLDIAWLEEPNIRTGIFYAGKDLIDIVRLSFQPKASVESGTFTQSQLEDLNKRYQAIKNWCKEDVSWNINCDQEAGIDSWYNAGPITNYSTRAQRWAKVIDMSCDWFKQKGLKNLVSISPFNEPDYGWGQGYSNASRKEDFKQICRIFKEDAAYKDKYAGVRICGGNTLNPDYATEWWQYLKSYVDEGCTHQLAGSFDNYAKFFETVRNSGQHATADELHNVMEAMVGVEYGMQTGIWWGTCERTRSEFMKATYHGNPGSRLAYGEHRGNWTSASVYRQADGRVQAFVGTSERQAFTTRYTFASQNRPVYYDGIRGRHYQVNALGGTGYQKGQTGFETVVDVQSEDVMPVVNGTYKIMNVGSGKMLCGQTSVDGFQNVRQLGNNIKPPVYMQWRVSPSTIDGDRAYHKIEMNHETQSIYLDIKDWDYNTGATIGTYPGGFGTNEQWYLEYAGNNAFRIRSRYSTCCLAVHTTGTGQPVYCDRIEEGNAKQLWRFIPVDVATDLIAPAAPSQLQAIANKASVTLSWTAPADKDIASYDIMRSEDGEHWYTLCNQITTTEFTDNEAEPDHFYYYSVRACDKSLNRSVLSESCRIGATGERGCVLSLPLESDLYDLSDNANHAAAYSTKTYKTTGEHTGVVLDGLDDYIQLPYTIANSDEITISAWVYYRGGNQWQRIFDFGHGVDNYLFLTANCGQGLRLAAKCGGSEINLTPQKIITTNAWHHIAITIGAHGAAIYLEGNKIGENSSFSIRPSDIRPVLNYIGRSQFAEDPAFNGYISDFRIYNYAMTPEEVAALPESSATAIEEVSTQDGKHKSFDVNGLPATQNSHIIIKNGKKFAQ